MTIIFINHCYFKDKFCLYEVDTAVQKNVRAFIRTKIVEKAAESAPGWAKTLSNLLKIAFFLDKNEFLVTKTAR